MDQTLQARLIGATVLVALAVLLIPELLSGRKTVEPAVEEGAAARGTRSFTIELGATGGQSTVPVSPASPSTTPTARTQPAPAGQPTPTEATQDAAVRAEPPAVEARPRVAPAPLPASGGEATDPTPADPARPEPAPSPGLGTPGGWVVQVGAFGSADAARRLVDELGAAGFEAQAAPITRSGRTLHRVRVGPAGGRPAAEQMAQRLQARGLPAAVVAND